VSGFPRRIRFAGWLAIVAMVVNLCAGVASVPTATAAVPDAPACCCGEACACGPGCACSVAPADPAESRPEVPAPTAPAGKLVPLAMPGRGVERPATIASELDRAGPTTRSRPVDGGQREIRLRTGICTT
jgi:hypothetical protein